MQTKRNQLYQWLLIIYLKNLVLIFALQICMMFSLMAARKVEIDIDHSRESRAL